MVLCYDTIFPKYLTTGQIRESMLVDSRLSFNTHSVFLCVPIYACHHIKHAFSLLTEGRNMSGKRIMETPVRAIFSSSVCNKAFIDWHLNDPPAVFLNDREDLLKFTCSRHTKGSAATLDLILVVMN